MEVIKSFGEKPNGNGVFVTKNRDIVVVYSNGFLTDYITAFSNGDFRGEIEHSKTTRKLIQRAIKFLEKSS